MPQDRLAGKVALITGAGRGFGQAIGGLFAGAGADLALHYRASRAGCEEIADAVRAGGGKALTVQADLADGRAIEALAARVFEEFGRIDILVNNAGTMRLGPFAGSSAITRPRSFSTSSRRATKAGCFAESPARSCASCSSSAT